MMFYDSRYASGREICCDCAGAEDSDCERCRYNGARLDDDERDGDWGPDDEEDRMEAIFAPMEAQS